MHLPSRLMVLLVFAASLAYFALLVPYGFSVADEGAVVEQIERLADGERLYHDFHIGYTPVFYYTHAWVMQAFGHSLLPLRWVLALVNALSVALVFLLGMRLSDRTWVGVLAAVFATGVLPVGFGQFAIANIPYPVWYNTLLWLGGTLALVGFDEKPSLWRLAVAGICAGLGFGFKPNVGLFQIAAYSLVVLSAIPTHGYRRTRPTTFDLATWWAWWLGIVAGVIFVFSSAAGGREYAIFVVPGLVGALLVAWRAAVVGKPRTEVPSTFACGLVLVGSFMAVNLPWLAYYYFDLGLARFLERVVFFGSGFEHAYFVPHAPVQTTAIGAVLAFLLAQALPKSIRRWGYEPENVAIVSGFGALALYFLSLQLGDSPATRFESTRAVFDTHAPGVTIAIHWLGLWLLARSINGAEDAARPTYRLGLVTIGAIFLYMQVYPRSSSAHWARSIAMTSILVFVVAEAVVLRWATNRSRWRYLALAIALSALFALVPTYRISQVLAGVVPLASGSRPSVSIESEKAPLWTDAGRASWYADVNAAVEFIRTRTETGERVFYFPAIGSITFMTDRRNATRHGYFFPTWPGRDVDAEVVASLRRSRPRYALVTHWHQLHFVDSGAYYYGIREHLQTEYEPKARFGRLVVFGLRGETPAAVGEDFRPPLDFEDAVPHELAADLATRTSSASEAERLEAVREFSSYRVRRHSRMLVARLEDASQAVRNEAVWALRNSMEARVSCALLRAVIAGRLSGPALPLAVEVGTRAADSRCAREVTELTGSFDPKTAAVSRAALFNMVERDFREDFWIGADLRANSRAAAPEPTDREWSDFRRTLAGKGWQDAAGRMIAVYRVARSSRPESTRVLKDFVEANRSGRAVTLAVWELAKRGEAGAYASIALAGLVHDPIFAPEIARVVLAQADDADAILSEFIRYSAGRALTEALWLSAYAGGSKTMDEVRRRRLSPIDIDRAASLWSLGNRSELLDPAVLAEGLSDDVPLVREMAIAAREAITLRSAATAGD